MHCPTGDFHGKSAGRGSGEQALAQNTLSGHTSGRVSFCDGPMTNQIAIILGLMILGLLGLDAFLFDGANILFLLRKMADMIEWMAFWR